MQSSFWRRSSVASRSFTPSLTASMAPKNARAPPIKPHRIPQAIVAIDGSVIVCDPVASVGYHASVEACLSDSRPAQGKDHARVPRAFLSARRWPFRNYSEAHTSELQSLRHLVCRLL